MKECARKGLCNGDLAQIENSVTQQNIYPQYRHSKLLVR